MSLIESYIAPGVIVGVALFMWRVMVRMENRIVANADKAHTVIGDNIKRLDGSMRTLNERIDTLRGEVSVLREDVGFIKGTLHQTPFKGVTPPMGAMPDPDNEEKLQ